MSFLSELKRRNVVRMAVLYAVGGWVLLQIADVLFDQLGVPPWAFRLVLGLLLLGFPVALIFSWVFELTPEGVKRTREVEPGQTTVEQTGRRMNVLIVVLLLVAIAGLVADRLVPESPATGETSNAVSETMQPPDQVRDPRGSDSDAENSIAVLPFVNMSDDRENEYFSEGLSEELLNTLVRLGGLKVTGRTSSFAFKNDNRDLREIGTILGVAHVLEGSVRKAGNQVRITAQLIKTSDGFHLWSDTFDRELDDIFAIQEEIAEQVAGALHVTLLGSAPVDHAVNVTASQDPRAYEEYLRGRYIWQRNPDALESLNSAREHYETALALDPDYVDALWGMFMVWDRMNRNGHGAFEDSLQQMTQFGQSLQQIAPNSDRALSALGRLAVVNFEYQEALDYLGRAATLFPANVSVLGEYASALATVARYEPALEVIEGALRLDPLSLELLRWKSYIAYRAGDCAAVEQVQQRALEIEPEVGRFRYYLAMCLFETTGETSRAVELAQSEPLLWARNTALAVLYHARGEVDLARDHLGQVEAGFGEAASYQLGQIHAQFGDTETALKWLEHAVEIRDPGIIQAVDDRLLDPVRDEPRFQALLQAVGH